MNKNFTSLICRLGSTIAFKCMPWVFHVLMPFKHSKQILMSKNCIVHKSALKISGVSSKYNKRQNDHLRLTVFFENCITRYLKKLAIILRKADLSARDILLNRSNRASAGDCFFGPPPRFPSVP